MNEPERDDRGTFADSDAPLDVGRLAADLMLHEASLADGDNDGDGDGDGDASHLPAILAGEFVPPERFEVEDHGVAGAWVVDTQSGEPLARLATREEAESMARVLNDRDAGSRGRGPTTGPTTGDDDDDEGAEAARAEAAARGDGGDEYRGGPVWLPWDRVGLGAAAEPVELAPASIEEYDPVADASRPMPDTPVDPVAWLARKAATFEAVAGWAEYGELYGYLAGACRRLAREIAEAGGMVAFRSSARSSPYRRPVGLGDPEAMREITS